MSRKPDWLYHQSAAIPYFPADDGCRVVLITNRKQTGWIYPKGVVERHLSAPESAANEAWEEAGVVGTVNDTLLDTYTYEKWGGICRVEVYPLEISEILDEWEEMDFRQRQTVDVEAAIHMIKANQKPALLQLRSYLDATRGP